MRSRLVSDREEPVGLWQARPVEGVTERAGIGEMSEFHAQWDIFGERLFALGAESIVLFRQHELADRHELDRRVIREVDMVGDA